jgi:hypothetical protein
MRQLFHTSTAYILTEVDSTVAGTPQGQWITTWNNSHARL